MHPSLEIPINHPRPRWSSLAMRFPGEKECLAAYIALETAEVLANAKPASLLSISNRERACGRNLYTLWKDHGNELLEETPLFAVELLDRGSSMLILFCHKIHFEEHIARRDITALLKRAGYGNEITPHGICRELGKRLQKGSFPHEIGLLLGYPPKDVAAFMGLIRIPFTCQGPWKIYGNPGASLRLAERFRQCRDLMAEQLSWCASAVQCLNDLAASPQSFFVPKY